jgi:hypothetical protein
MSIKLTSAETGRNKSAIAAAAGSGNKVSVAPFTSTYIKNTPSGWPTVNVGSIDTTNSTAIGQSVTVDAVYVTDSNWNILDDTALSSSGGFLKIIGTGFKTGAVAYLQGTPASATVVVSSTELRVTTPALTSGTLQVYVLNTDNTIGIRISGIVVSGVPSWTTSSPLPDQPLDIAFSLQLTAVSDSTVAYSLQSGSSLPSGVSLNSSGVLSGTVTGLLVDTTYSFTLVATDLELQDTAKVFSVTISFGDAYFKQSTLLLNGETPSNLWITDGSNTTKAFTVGGDTRPSAFSPYNTSWSAYFDGVNGSASIPDSALSEIGAGEFCVEFWAYIVTAPSGLNSIFGKRTTSAGFSPVSLFYRTNGTIRCYASTNGTTFNLLSDAQVGTFTFNNWTHIAVYRIGNTIYGAVNGVVVTLTATGGTLINNTSPWAFGADYDNSAPSNLYMSDLRLVVGSPIYPATNFTPPTSKLTAVANTAFLTCQNNRLVDNGPNAFTITRPSTNAVLKSFSPFSETDLITGSAYFDGTTDYILVPDNASLELGSGDFCVECWIYPRNLGATGVIIDKRSGTYGPLLLWTSTNLLQLYMSSTNTSWDLVNGPTIGTVDINQWYHVAIYRVGSSIYTSFNGVVTLQNASGGAAPYNNAGNWYIGTNTDGSTNPWTGYIADMRFVIGSGVYASTNFSPPSTSLANVTNTKLLTFQTRIGENNQRFSDEGSAKALVTRFGNASQNSFTPFSPAGWSAYFGGVGNYAITNAAAFLTTQSTFTIECWIYMTATPGTNPTVVGDMSPTSTDNNWSFGPNSSNLLEFYWFDSSGKRATGTTSLALNQWYHIAVSVNANAIKLFVNGVSETLTGTTTLTTRSGTTSTIAVGQAQSSSFYYTGYISNLSILSGTAKYSGTFNPATSDLPTSTANQVFLFASTNQFIDTNTATTAKTVTPTGTNLRILPYSPFKPKSIYTPTSNGGSVYLDGTGDYLTIASDAITTLSTQDFTIEFWTYIIAHSAQTCLMDQRVATTTVAPFITANSTTTVFGNASTNRITGSGLTANQWNHIAVSRTAGNTRMFINGTQAGFYVDASAYVAGAIYVGSSYVPSQQLNGYISDFNVSRTGKYTSNFTVSNTTTSIAGNTLSRLEFNNAGIIDYTGKNSVETIGTARISAANSKYGTSSISFNTKTDALAIPNSRLNSTFIGDFTIECWVYPSDATITHWGIYDARQSGGSAAAFVLSLEPLASPVSGSYRMGYYNAAFTYGTITVLSNVWTHVAWVRVGSTLTFYVNGVAGGTATVSGTLTGAATTNPIWIGTKDNATATYGNIGYIDDLRITNGIARYTGNFTPPTSAAPTT